MIKIERSSTVPRNAVFFLPKAGQPRAEVKIKL